MMKFPIDVLDDYPEIKKKWNCNDIGYLLRLGLIRGKKLRRGCLVYSEDVKALFDGYFK
jgi:hypothetical protein